MLDDEDLRPKQPAADEEMQNDIEEVDDFGFSGNDSDGGISMPSDDHSVGTGALSDDDFEVPSHLHTLVLQAILVAVALCSFCSAFPLCDTTENWLG